VRERGGARYSVLNDLTVGGGRGETGQQAITQTEVRRAESGRRRSSRCQAKHAHLCHRQLVHTGPKPVRPLSERGALRGGLCGCGRYLRACRLSPYIRMSVVYVVRPSIRVPGAMPRARALGGSRRRRSRHTHIHLNSPVRLPRPARPHKHLVFGAVCVVCSRIVYNFSLRLQLIIITTYNLYY
jgi:hypothetical protein